MLTAARAKIDTAGISEWEALGTLKELMQKCAAQVIWENLSAAVRALRSAV